MKAVAVAAVAEVVDFRKAREQEVEAYLTIVVGTTVVQAVEKVGQGLHVWCQI